MLVELFSAFAVAERVVELEVLIFDELGDAIYFVLALVHRQHRVAHRNDVDFSAFHFFLENRPFFDAHTDFELVRRDVLKL